MKSYEKNENNPCASGHKGSFVHVVGPIAYYAEYSVGSEENTPPRPHLLGVKCDTCGTVYHIHFPIPLPYIHE